MAPLSHPSPSNRPWLVSCNQAPASGETHHGFGTLWMRYDRRGDFSRDFADLSAEATWAESIGWNRVGRGASIRFVRALVDYFFSRATLSFHCLVVEKDLVNLDCHNGDSDLAQRKHFTMLLANKVKLMLTKKRRADQEFVVWVAPIPSAYAKAAEAVEVISANIVGQFSGRKPSLKVITRSVAQTPPIQVCDLLLGAVVGAWNRDAKNEEQRQLERQIAGHLGWPSLRHDTFHTDRKFNIWKFHDPAREPTRSATTRSTQTG